jgi:putative metalloprotease
LPIKDIVDGQDHKPRLLAMIMRSPKRQSPRADVISPKLLIRPLAHAITAPHIETMLRLAPILLAVGYGFASYRFSVWRTQRELDHKSKPLTDPMLRQLCGQMAGALDLKQIKVHIYEIEPVNGLAAPDGRIFITRGFFNKYKAGEVSADEMASVIAHELGHVALGHARRRMIDFSGQNAARTAIGMVLSRFLPFGIGHWIASQAMRLLAAGLSRKDEFEADAYASALLIKSGIGTAPQISLFHKLETLTGARGAKIPAWIMSHPKTDQRIAAIENNSANWQP